MVEVKVEYDYDAEQDDELSIHVGNIIKNVTRSEGGWWEGELNGNRGLFPDNFVKVIKPIGKDEEKKEEKKEEKEVSNKMSKQGHIAEMANKIKDGVQVDAMLWKKQENIGRKKLIAKVQFDYKPENDDELELHAGESVEIIKQEEEGWLRGTLNGKEGVFPTNFVEIHETDEKEKSGKLDEPEKESAPEVKVKKVKGVGLGNIFSGGPIKLRPASGIFKKPSDDQENKSEKSPVNVVPLPKRQKADLRMNQACFSCTTARDSTAGSGLPACMKPAASDNYCISASQHAFQCCTPLSFSQSLPYFTNHLKHFNETETGSYIRCDIPELGVDLELRSASSGEHLGNRDEVTNRSVSVAVENTSDCLYGYGTSVMSTASPDANNCNSRFDRDSKNVEQSRSDFETAHSPLKPTETSGVGFTCKENREYVGNEEICKDFKLDICPKFMDDCSGLYPHCSSDFNYERKVAKPEFDFHSFLPKNADIEQTPITLSKSLPANFELNMRITSECALPSAAAKDNTELTSRAMSDNLLSYHYFNNSHQTSATYRKGKLNENLGQNSLNVFLNETKKDPISLPLGESNTDLDKTKILGHSVNKEPDIKDFSKLQFPLSVTGGHFEDSLSDESKKETYLAFLNRNNQLSPFMKIVANRYSLTNILNRNSCNANLQGENLYVAHNSTSRHLVEFLENVSEDNSKNIELNLDYTIRGEPKTLVKHNTFIVGENDVHRFIDTTDQTLPLSNEVQIDQINDISSDENYAYQIWSAGENSEVCFPYSYNTFQRLDKKNISDCVCPDLRDPLSYMSLLPQNNYHDTQKLNLVCEMCSQRQQGSISSLELELMSLDDRPSRQKIEESGRIKESVDLDEKECSDDCYVQSDQMIIGNKYRKQSESFCMERHPGRTTSGFLRRQLSRVASLLKRNSSHVGNHLIDKSIQTDISVPCALVVGEELFLLPAANEKKPPTVQEPCTAEFSLKHSNNLSVQNHDRLESISSSISESSSSKVDVAMDNINKCREKQKKYFFQRNRKIKDTQSVRLISYKKITEDPLLLIPQNDSCKLKYNDSDDREAVSHFSTSTYSLETEQTFGNTGSNVKDTTAGKTNQQLEVNGNNSCNQEIFDRDYLDMESIQVSNLDETNLEPDESVKTTLLHTSELNERIDLQKDEKSIDHTDTTIESEDSVMDLSYKTSESTSQYFSFTTITDDDNSDSDGFSTPLSSNHYF